MIRPIRDRRTFQALRTEGTRVRRGPLSVVHLDLDGTPGTAVAYAITKRVGGAVDRNRLRRRLRAIMATLAEAPDGPVPPGALLVGAGPAASDRDARELRNDVEQLLEILGTRLERKVAE